MSSDADRELLLESNWSLLKHWLSLWFVRLPRPMTAAEAELHRKVQSLEHRLQVKEDVELDLRLRIKNLQSDVEAARYEVDLLALIHESDRKRWERLTAVRAERIGKLNRPSGGQ